MATLQLPPGLEYNGQLVETSNGGVSDWVAYKKVKLYTNAFVILNDAKVLLGYKKRGFGTGLWNGFGGKVDPGETPLQAAVRELEEEAGIEAPLEHCGVLFFVVDGADAAFHIDIFRADEYTGTVSETDEMRPEWFSVQKELLPLTNPQTTADHDHDHAANPQATEEEGPEPETEGLPLPDIPLKQMWADDEFWMPLMFSRRFFVGRADFDADDKMLKWWFAAAPASLS
ncbi:NUDIX-domain-containing protein [Lentinus tigrinus ALCF2SS1-7]|uniref:Oxidized purine nucleoside triphosphate hydrolase n=1 Tax=Lentinus tigrinus ALCF2SS1-6 TaxID=1328759 RepID=A0A5C2S0R6_9APHY|nr:NUDIX-domain-containing protein [Lentinus tigrinus ALCF2SS1-6]RPD71757.1 NUDIX-domain-containing protein [Lentinus tigrinus ALCF2SS1-7]